MSSEKFSIADVYNSQPTQEEPNAFSYIINSKSPENTSRTPTAFDDLKPTGDVLHGGAI